jgi:hypothetical protein
MPWHQALKSGAMVHTGNAVESGQVYPLMITRVWADAEGKVSEGTAFNGQLMLDGSDAFWVTSTKIGDREGECFWPPREEKIDPASLKVA